MGAHDLRHPSTFRSYDLCKREVTVHDALPREEMNVLITWTGDAVVVSGQYESHFVALRTWVAHPQGKPSVNGPEATTAHRYVRHEQNHWGVRSWAIQESFPVRQHLSNQEVEETCVQMLSDILCGASARASIEHRLGGFKPNYDVGVVGFPGDEWQRRGDILLCADNSGPIPELRLRVVGESRSYTGSRLYDASASVETRTAGDWIGEMDALARRVTEMVMSGTPAPFAFPNGLVGVRGPYAVTSRDALPGIELSGLERVVAGQLAGCVDSQNTAIEDLGWAEAGPTVWDRSSCLHEQRRAAADHEVALLDDLAQVGVLCPGREWIFREDVPFKSVRNDLLIS